MCVYVCVCVRPNTSSMRSQNVSLHPLIKSGRLEGAVIDGMVRRSSLRDTPSKETYVRQKRPMYGKRDLCTAKETYVRQKRPM